LGADIDGEAATDTSGRSLSLSSNGTIIAIGADGNDGTTGNVNDSRGHVRIYRIDLSNTALGWRNLGNDIDGEATTDGSGYSVSLSGDGSIVAIGARFNDGTSASSDRGHVRVYQLNVSTNIWRQLGPDIDGETAGDHFGYSVALSRDGLSVAIGAINNDGTSGTSLADRGHVRIYKRDLPINGLYINAPLLTSNIQASGYATVGGILGVTGATVTNSTLSIVGATTMTSLTAGSNATIGGTLTINGATTLSSTLNITGATTTSTLTTSSNATVGGTLNITGATTLTALNYTDKIMQW
jgi:hypothetical protein